MSGAAMDAERNRESSVKEEKRVNAEAGPSSQPGLPVVFLPPPGLSRRKPPINSTEDLISRFQLLHSYDKYVRPYVHSTIPGEVRPSAGNANARFQSPNGTQMVSTPGVVDKGKGREVPLGASSTLAAAATPGVDGGDGDDGEEDGMKEDKKKKNYRHLIKGIPGKHSMKKDDYLQTMMFVPPKQHIKISEFDQRIQHDAFSVSLEGLKGWNINTLVAESPQAREDRKRRKELKKLAKAQAAQTGLPPPAALATASVTVAPVSGVRQPQTPASAGIGTPRPQGPGPGPPSHTQVPGTGPPRTATPVPRPGSRKRDLEEDGLPNGHLGAKRPAPVPGSAGARNAAPGAAPRPAKRPRTEGTPHQMGLPVMPQQQPTPQGV